MKLSDTVIDTAVMRIFRNYMITRAGGRLTFETLQADWQQLQVRRDDLFCALERLKGNGLLAEQMDADGLQFVLTEEGADRIGEMPRRPNALLHRMIDVIRLSAADHRQPSDDGGSHNRRRDDSASASAE